jgi:hypothetical protein
MLLAHTMSIVPLTLRPRARNCACVLLPVAEATAHCSLHLLPEWLHQILTAWPAWPLHHSGGINGGRIPH